jgi:alpha-galactosidase
MPKIVLIGAGSANFGLGTLADIFHSQTLRGSRVVLHDINAEALARVEGAAKEYLAVHRVPYTVSATTARKEALQGADFCIISIEVGDRFKLWDQDWMIPLQYGIRQVYGENGGPGGLFHSLRIIPPILEICGDIAAICPQAHVFNFSNPMSRICLTVKRKYPQLHFTGLCHEIASLPQHLPAMLGVPFEELIVKAGGLNHFSVVLECRYKKSGQDAYPDILAKAPAYFADVAGQSGWISVLLRGQGEEHESRPWAERGLFKVILERYGLLPITTDSHFGEYIQWAADVVDHQGILDFYRAYQLLCAIKREPHIADKSTTERVIPMIEGIVSDSGQAEMAVNVLNDGLMENLPRDLVVEVPGTVDKQGVHGVPLGVLPKGFAALLNNQAAVLDLTAEAVLTGSRAVVLQAMLADPVVTSVRAAEECLDTILKLQHKHLGYIK